MKKILLISALIAIVSLGNNLQAEVQCFTPQEAETVDFWLDHFYYATCTDWEGTGSKLFGDNSEYVDFNGGSTVEFPVWVSRDGEYTVTLAYGIGWTDDAGATVTVNVNDEFATQLVLHKLTADPPATIDFSVELYADYDNVIQLQQVKDWPIINGMQLSANFAGTEMIHSNDFKVISADGAISVAGLTGKNQIEIFSITGQILDSSIVSSASYNFMLKNGLYILKVNDSVRKVLVR